MIACHGCRWAAGPVELGERGPDAVVAGDPDALAALFVRAWESMDPALYRDGVLYDAPCRPRTAASTRRFASISRITGAGRSTASASPRRSPTWSACSAAAPVVTGACPASRPSKSGSPRKGTGSRRRLPASAATTRRRAPCAACSARGFLPAQERRGLRRRKRGDQRLRGRPPAGIHRDSRERGAGQAGGYRLWKWFELSQ